MPNKKGSRVAASQARAQAAAKKKARGGGPDLSAAARPAPAETPELEDGAELDEGAVAVEATAADHYGETAVAVPAPRRLRAASRRERHAMTAVSAGSLQWEVSLIAGGTVMVGIGLAVIKLTTDLGR